MALALTPNAEKVVADYLRDHPDVLAITDERRVGSRTPDSIDLPWVRYTQLNARTPHRSDHLLEVFIQLDCYAGKDGVSDHTGQPGASLLARTVRAAMMALPEAGAVGAVVTGVDPRGHARIPDTDLDNRERFILQFVVWMH